VLAQAPGLDVPQPEQSPGRDLRLGVVRAHPGPVGQDLSGHGCELVHHVALVSPQRGRGDNGKTTYVTYRIEPHAGGTRFTYDHTGFTGAGGFLLAKLLGSVRKKMLTAGLPAVLDELDETGTLRVTSSLRTKPLS